MKKLSKTILLVVVLICTMYASASAITIDGNFNDWFDEVWGMQKVDAIANDTTGEIDHGFTNGIYWAEEDYVESGTYGQVYPGYGGQSFDHEGLYLTEDANTYYIGLMTGMAPGANYSSWSTTPQYIGDIAIDTGNGFDMALCMAEIRDPSGVNPPYLYYGITDWIDTSPYHPQYNPTPYKVSSATGTHLTDFSYAQHGDSYFYEFGIDKQHLNMSNGLTAFVTMSCGNDWLQIENHTPSVPEPATMILFGTGLMTLAGLKRKKECGTSINK